MNDLARRPPTVDGCPIEVGIGGAGDGVVDGTGPGGVALDLLVADWTKVFKEEGKID